jgi:integrase
MAGLEPIPSYPTVNAALDRNVGKRAVTPRVTQQMLTDTKIRNSKPGEKPYKLYDDRGLYLLLNPTGTRWWRLKYYFSGKERGLSLGVYPDVPLKDARERRDEARRLLARGVDPSAHRQAARESREHTFQIVADEWLALQAQKLSAATITKARWMLESFVYPRLGSRPIAEIAAPELLAVLRRIESRGTNETAHRTKQRCSQIFRYAVATGRAARDVTVDLRGALAPVVSESHAAITEPAKIGALLRAIDGYDGHPTTAVALKLAPLVFVRPGELRGAEWSEIDLEAAEWRIPAERMKMGERHIVPLASQAVALLREQWKLTGSGKYVFPSLRSRDRPMSMNTVNAALRRLGYTGDEMTGHGFRAMASTCLNEQGWNPDLIELQLAHAERNRVRAAYNRAERLVERRKLMAGWADYLERLRKSSSKTEMS